MSFYLSNDIFIDFDYRQNIVDSDCVLISKEFGKYNYDRSIDSINLNLPRNLLNERVLVSDKVLTSMEDKCFLINNVPSSLLDIMRMYNNKELKIYLDPQNYVFVFSWFFKSFCPNIEVKVLYSLYSQLLVSQISLGYLENSKYLLSENEFESIFNSVPVSNKDNIEFLQKRVNMFLKFATIASGGYTLDQIEDLKAILIKRVETFYINMISKIYRKLVENFNFLEDSEFLFRRGNRIIWKIMSDKEISKPEDVDLDMVKHFCENPNLSSEFTKDAIEVQVVGLGQSFKKLLSLKQEAYQRLNKRYSHIIRADPAHYFFMDRSPTRFNPVEFIKYMSNFGFNSDFFSTTLFKGLTPFTGAFILNLVRKADPNIKCFSLNKLD